MSALRDTFRREGRTGNQPVRSVKALEGLCAAVSVRLPEPQFAGACAQLLDQPGIVRGLSHIVRQGIQEYSQRDQPGWKAVVQKVGWNIFHLSRSRLPKVD
jgi:DNA gyrase/topoisomerase IV subunit B